MELYLSTIDEKAHVLAKQYGLGLEIAEYCTAWNLDDRFPQTDARVQEKIAGISQLTLHAPYNELFPCAIDPQARALAKKRYRQAAMAAKRYGAEKVVVHGGYHPKMYYPVWYTRQSILFWQEFLQEVPDVQIVLENVLEEEPGMLLDILRDVDDPRLTMCLDVGHANVYSEIPVADWLETCAPYIRHFHVHNNDGSWDTHSPLTEGTMDIRALLKKAEELCPAASVTLELPDGEESVRWLLEE